MKESYIEKIHKAGRIGVIITNISRVFLAVGVCALILAACVRATVPKGTRLSFQTQATLTIDTANNSGFGAILTNNMWNDKLTFSFNDVEYFDVKTEHYLDRIVQTGTSAIESADLSMGVWVFAASAISLLLLTVIFNNLHSLCEKFKVCETPFTVEIADIIKKIAVYMMIAEITNILFSNLMTIILNGKFNIELDIDFVMILGVILVFLLSTIFRYGRMLQQESDETL